MGISVLHISHHTQLLLNLRWPVIVWLIASAVADVALTGSLVLYMVR
jgi:hypothetical protein